MKTNLVRLDDFVAHLREDKVNKAYYLTQTRQIPGGAIPQLSSYMIFTAKTADDKKLFILPILLKSAGIENEEQAKAFNAEVGKMVSELITLFQDKYASCFLTEGSIE
ncbi:MAG: hypothetical protein PHS46_08290 [Candidatus Omnitrophica bacterium]|nr:hypothetical protein [Candidatus Omnitrophota bacterium]